MQQKIRSIISSIESLPFSLGAWVITFTALVAGRLGIEHVLNDMTLQTPGYYFYQSAHHFFTFLCIFLVILIATTWLARVKLREAANILTVGFLLIWIPPIIDEIATHGKGTWSFYTFDSILGLWQRYLTFFGDQPEIGITYGIRVEIAIAVIALGLYTFMKTGKLLRGLFATWVTYTLFFFLGALPSFVTFALLGWEKGFLLVSENDIAGLMLSPTALFGLIPPSSLSSLSVKMSLVFASLDIILIDIILFFFFRTYFIARWKNARIPQIFFHNGLLLLGGSLALVYAPGSFTPDLFHGLALFISCSSVTLAWLASVVINDFSDQKIDALTNPTRPLQSGSIPPDLYQTFGILFFLASLLLMALVSTQATIFLAIYQGIAWLYSAPPLRLKRFPLVATGLASGASLLILLSGYLVFAAEKSISALPWQIPVFFFVAYTLLIPIKDFKDTPGDRADGVLTLPVLLGEVRAKHLIGAFYFFFFITSIFIFHLEHLFPLALFYATGSYWLLQISGTGKKYFHYHNLPGWEFLLIASFILFLLRTLLG